MDLNAFLYQMETNLADFLGQLGRVSQSQLFRDKAVKRQLAFDHIFWNAQDNQWKDYVLDKHPEDCNLKGVFASNWIPTWVGILPGPGVDGSRQDIQNAKKAVVEALKSSGLILPGGMIFQSYGSTSTLVDHLLLHCHKQLVHETKHTTYKVMFSFFPSCFITTRSLAHSIPGIIHKTMCLMS